MLKSSKFVQCLTGAFGVWMRSAYRFWNKQFGSAYGFFGDQKGSLDGLPRFPMINSRWRSLAWGRTEGGGWKAEEDGTPARKIQLPALGGVHYASYVDETNSTNPRRERGDGPSIS
jgi:hypothetical protein